MGEGYAIVMSPCFGCGIVFSYNPHKVPSIKVDSQGRPSPTGTREPICGVCVFAANIKRAENGLDPIVVLPGAYEPISEGQL